MKNHQMMPVQAIKDGRGVDGAGKPGDLSPGLASLRTVLAQLDTIPGQPFGFGGFVGFVNGIEQPLTSSPA